jgi:hypothetical protein
MARILLVAELGKRRLSLVDPNLHVALAGHDLLR